MAILEDPAYSSSSVVSKANALPSGSDASPGTDGAAGEGGGPASHAREQPPGPSTALRGGCCINPGEATGSLLRVGSENGHRIPREGPIRRDVVGDSCSGTRFRERAAAFLRRLCATATARCRSASIAPQTISSGAKEKRRHLATPTRRKRSRRSDIATSASGSSGCAAGAQERRRVAAAALLMWLLLLPEIVDKVAAALPLHSRYALRSARGLHNPNAEVLQARGTIWPPVGILVGP
jgi:hypothetical protein